MTFLDSVRGMKVYFAQCRDLKSVFERLFCRHNKGMLAEYLKFLTSPASTYAKELGYLKESIAFESRAQRNWKLWENHFTRCQDLIFSKADNSAKPARPTRNIWVLGSGSLYETPWQKLADQGRKIKLVDVYHPPRVKKLIKGYSQVQCVQMDVTGFDDLSPLQKVLLKSPVVPPLSVHPNDLMISCNMLSQLPICPLQYLMKNTDISVEEKIQWARRLQAQHWNWLQSFGCEVLVISDFEIHHLGKNSEVLRIEEQPFRPLAEKSAAWDWQWADDCVRKVEAYSIPRKA